MDATSSVTSTTSTSGFGLTTASQKAMGRDEFLKLLVEQIKNQDPLNPQENYQFVAELAQFSNLEQSMGINDRLDILALQSRGQSNAQVVGLVGQVATVQGSTVTTDGSGSGIPISFTLNGAAEKSTVTILDQNGEVVRKLEMGARLAGVVNLTWDGRGNSGNLQPSGSYRVSVTATNESGAAVSVEQKTVGLVEAISFDQGYPVLHLDNGAVAPVSDLLRVDSPPSDP